MCMLLFFPAGQRLQEVDFYLENEVLEQLVFVLVCRGCSLRDVQAEFCHEEVLNIDVLSTCWSVRTWGNYRFGDSSATRSTPVAALARTKGIDIQYFIMKFFVRVKDFESDNPLCKKIQMN